jgi:hypothetical protein
MANVRIFKSNDFTGSFYPASAPAEAMQTVWALRAKVPEYGYQTPGYKEFMTGFREANVAAGHIHFSNLEEVAGMSGHFLIKTENGGQGNGFRKREIRVEGTLIGATKGAQKTNGSLHSGRAGLQWVDCWWDTSWKDVKSFQEEDWG